MGHSSDCQTIYFTNSVALCAVIENSVLLGRILIDSIALVQQPKAAN
jgi:hypothetical protein